MKRSRHQIVMTFLVVFAGLVALLMEPEQMARGDQGVGISTGSITINDQLSPGRKYNLPSVNVVNTGDEPGNYRLAITFLEGQEEFRVGEGWISFEPGAFSLDPEGTQSVEVKLQIPSGARPGEYFAFIEAQTVPEGGGTQLGVAAAARLRFIVKPATLIEGYFNNVRTFFEGFPIWAWSSVGIFITALTVFLIRRWAPVRIRLERRS